MKTNLNTIKGLLIWMSVGLVLGMMWVGEHEMAPLALAIGGGLFYMHRRWIKSVNRSKNGPKIKAFKFL